MKPHQIVLWPLWFGLTVSLFFYQEFLGDGFLFPFGNPEDLTLSAGLWIFLPLLVATCIRWALLPRFRTFQQILPVFIAGLAIGELPVFFCLFLIPDPSHELQMLALACALLCQIQFLPVFLLRQIIPN